MIDQLEAGQNPAIPNVIMTDAITIDGSVRVGWLGLGVEHDLQYSRSVKLEDLQSLLSAYPVDRIDQLRTRGRVDTRQLRDVQLVCTSPECDVKVEEDAARLSFDMFRYCFAMSIEKWYAKASSSASKERYFDLYHGVRSNIEGRYLTLAEVGVTSILN